MRLFIICSLLLLTSHSWADLSFTTRSGDEINIHHHPANGQNLLIWLPSEAGPQPSEALSAQQLSQQNTEVWRVNLLEDYFLPIVASSMERLPDSAVSELIAYAIQKSKKNVYLVTSGRGAIPFLRGARQWQLQNPNSTGLSGIILLSPKFFVETPDPGVDAQLMPIITTSNLPIFIIQPEKSPWYWKLDKTVPALQNGGSDVYVRKLKNVRDRFFFRPDATDYEKQLGKQLPGMLSQSMKLLKPYQSEVRKVQKEQQQRPQIKVGKKDRTLMPYKGNSTPPALKLEKMNKGIIDLANMKGNVVLVNFWATWCPPCVHEMPSMQRLQDKFQSRPFTILGVNMAEDKNTIQKFLSSKVKVNFPVVMDSDGAALRKWGVFAFPTSYVIDKRGRIRYALFGGVEWDTPDIIHKISKLLDE